MKLGLVACLMCVLASCSIAELRPTEWQQTGGPDQAAIQAGQELLAAMQAAHGPAPRALELRVRDLWQSTVLRWFTPLSENDTEFFARAALEPPLLQALLREQTVLWPEQSSGWDAVYAESLHRYFFFPLLEYEALAALPDAPLLGSNYHRLWVQLDEDQAVFWLEPNSQRVRWVQFTFREVTRSYSGWLHYSLLRDFAGAKLAGQIRVLDEPDDKQAVHTLWFEPR